MLFAIVGLVSAAPAGAGTEQSPEITDVAGDANVASTTGAGAGLRRDTRPASIDGADMVKIWFRTDYETVWERDEQGAIVRVAYVATGLRAFLRTTATLVPPPGEIDGPGVRFLLSAEATSPCRVDLIYRAPSAGPPEASIRFGGNASCAVPGTVTSSQFAASSSDGLLTLAFPFSGLAGTPQGGQLRDGTVLSGGSAYTQFYFADTYQSADFVSDEFTFTVGSDVPSDIECAEAPEHPECGE